MQIDVTGVCVMCCLLTKSKVSMMSLCSTAAHDCPTGLSKGRYCDQERSILLVLVDCMNAPSKFVLTPL